MNFFRLIFREWNISFRSKKIIPRESTLQMQFEGARSRERNFISYRWIHIASSFFFNHIKCKFAREDYHRQNNLRFCAQLRNVAWQFICSNTIGRRSPKVVCRVRTFGLNIRVPSRSNHHPRLFRTITPTISRSTRVRF